MQRVYKKEASRSRRNRGPAARGRVVEFEASGETATLRLAWPAAELLAALQEGLSSLAVEGGLLLAEALLADEVEQRVGARYEHQPERMATRWGSEAGYVAFAGRKVAVRRPRVRDTAGREVVLERYRQLQSPGRLGEDVARRMLCGVSTRDYPKALDTFCEGYGIDKSSVSRQWKTVSAARLRELVERPLGDLDLAVIFLDGIRFQGYLFVVALGVDAGGRKHILGLWEGATENATVVSVW